MISEERVTETAETIAEMGMEEMQELAARMQSEQPFVMVYLLAISQSEGFTDEESDLFFFIGIVVWQVMQEQPEGKRKITEQILDRAERANETLLEKMAEDSEGDFISASYSIALSSPEPEVFRYIVESVMEDEDGNSEAPSFSEEHLGPAFLNLKIVLDAFIEAQK